MSDEVMTAELAPKPGIVLPWWVLLLQGIAATVIGILLVTKTGVTTVTLVYFIGWWWLVGGVFELASLFMDRTAWGWKLFSGLLSLFAGAYVIASPLLGAAVIVGTATLLLGINGIIIGVADIVRSFQGAGWGKGVLGLLSAGLGAVIAFNFVSFAPTLPWLWGVFAIVFGIMGIVGAFAAKKAQSA
jgi:uncharacterized membrane protein HdeD (DUF308 family)